MGRVKAFEGIDWANGRDRGYHVVTIGPDATPEDVQAFRDAYDLGCAWAEVEAALPDEWAIRIMTCNCSPDRTWKVSAGPDLGPLADPAVYVEDTPAAALRALAAKLRERAG